MRKKGLTIIEMMVVIIIFQLVVAALWYIFKNSKKTAVQIMTSHAINDELDKTFIKIIDDIREANAIDAYSPPVYEESEIDGLTSENEKNQLKFIKINYDFTKNPAQLNNDEVNYTSEQIRYYLKSQDSKYILVREAIPLDNRKQPIEGEIKEKEVLKGIEECVFYRVKDAAALRSGNVYIKIKLGHMNGGNYANESIISVKERGAFPES